VKTIVHFEFGTPEEAIEALARLRGIDAHRGTIAGLAPTENTGEAAAAVAAPKPSGKGAASQSSAATSPSAAQGQASAPTSPPPPPATALPATGETALAPPLKTLVDLVLRGATEKRPETVAVLAKYKAMKASQVAEKDRAACIDDLVAVLKADDSLTG
jgi:hypothetical protein